MRLLCLSDIHGRTVEVDRLLKVAGKIDMVIISGDITHLGGYEDAKRVIRPILDNGLDVIAVAGNMDTSDVIEYLKKTDISIDGRARVIGDIGFFGVGGSNSSIFKTPNEIPSVKMKELMESGYREIADREVKVFVSHAPPKNTSLDRSFTGIHAGSKEVSEFISDRDIDLCICGHIHESAGEENIHGTICVNVGPYKSGYFCIVDIGNKIMIDRRRL